MGRAASKMSKSKNVDFASGSGVDHEDLPDPEDLSDPEELPDPEDLPDPEQGPTENRGPGTNSSHPHARQNDEKYNSSTLPRKLFQCNQCDPPRYFIVDALTHNEVIDHIMETNHAIGIDEVPPLSVLKKFHFLDPWVDQ